MKSSRFFNVAYDVFHVFLILPTQLKLLSLFASFVSLVSAILDFISLIFVGLFVEILSNHGSVAISDSYGSYALQIASNILDFFPSKLYFPLIYIVILGSILLRVFVLVINPYVVKQLSLVFGFRLVKAFTTMSIISFRQVSLSEFRTVLTEDLSSLINNAVRPTLALSSSLFALMAACTAACISSPKLFCLLILTSFLCYFLYNKLYFNKMSLYLSNVIPFYDRSKSSMLEYIYHNMDLIKLYDKSTQVEESFSHLSSKRDGMVGVQNISTGFPRLLIEFLILLIFLLIGSYYLFFASVSGDYQTADLAILFLSLTKAASSFQIMFQNFGTLFTNSRQLHTVASKL